MLVFRSDTLTHNILYVFFFRFAYYSCIRERSGVRSTNVPDFVNISLVENGRKSKGAEVFPFAVAKERDIFFSGKRTKRGTREKLT